jgi:hypothetical protein
MIDMDKLSLLPARQHAAPVRSPGDPHEAPDACAYLFEVCRDLQRAYLDRCHAELLFDVEPGRVPREICRALASMLYRFILELTEAVPSPAPDGVVGIALRRRGASWVAVLHDRGLRRYEPTRHVALAPASALAARLNGTCEIRARNDARTMTVTLDMSEARQVPRRDPRLCCVTAL